MAQVVLYALRTTIDKYRAGLSAAISAAMVDTLQTPPEKQFQRFIGLAPEDFIYPPDRGEEYTIIEVSLFEGRSEQTKRAFIATLLSQITARTQIAAHSVEITLMETPRVNWGIRGSNAADLELNYRVEI